VKTKLISRNSSAITEESIQRTVDQVERAIAQALEPDEVMKAYKMAAACKLLAKQVYASRSIQNKCAASHTKAVRKVGELTKQMRDDGVLVRNGGKRVSLPDGQTELSVGTDGKLTLPDLGISSPLPRDRFDRLSLPDPTLPGTITGRIGRSRPLVALSCSVPTKQQTSRRADVERSRLPSAAKS
jgi:hypothetical protein